MSAGAWSRVFTLLLACSAMPLASISANTLVNFDTTTNDNNNSDAADDPVFVDRTEAQDFSHQYTGGWEHFVGGGVTVFDCNDDGFLDAYAAGGESVAALMINQSQQPGDPLRFTIDPESRLALNGVTGSYALDIDNDGILDLAVLRVGSNHLYRGAGNCQFELADELWKFTGGDRWTTAFSATWEPDQSLPTLAIGNYVNRDDPEGPFFACDDNELHRPVDDHYAPPIALTPGHCALSMLFSDWGRQGRQDLFISNDRHYYVRGGAEQLWRLDSTPVQFTEQDGWLPLSIWGMGITSRDLDGDALPEMFLTSMGDQKLRMLDGDSTVPRYRDASFARGTTAHVPYTGDDGRPSSGWHAAFGDINNDGFDDLFIAKGNVEQMPDSAMHDPNNLLMQQPDGSFVEMGLQAGVANPARSRGAAVVDLNRDGRLDILVNSRRAPFQILENSSHTNHHWLSVGLRQSGINTQAIGAWIELSSDQRQWHREITAGGGHAGNQAGPEHFGLGPHKAVQLRIRWPDGVVSEWLEPGIDHQIVVERVDDTVRLKPHAQ